jgi:RloB-like protein
MPRRELGAERRGASQDQRLRILVVCGAERTEIDYLKGLRGLVESRSVELVVMERPSAPHQVVAFARDYKSPKDFEERWCVIDVDNFEREGKKISAAVQIARECEASLAISNPCFEFWLLLHHAYRTPPAIVCRDIEAVLREYVKDYDKARLRFSEFADGIKDAVERARKIDPTGVEHSINPSTGMWRLVERIMH